MVEAEAPLQLAVAPFTNAVAADAVKVTVSVPTGSGFGEIAVRVGPAASGLT